MKSTEITLQNGWQGFRLGKPEAIRALATPEGVADRLRVVAFAELQARDLFLYGARRFPEVPTNWREAWIRFAEVEDRHAQMLLTRMEELGVEAGGRVVSDKLTRLCLAAPDAESFLFLLSSAEERGMEAGNVLGKQMAPFDAVSAVIFAQIAEEEVEHVETANAQLSGSDLDALKVRAREISASL